MKKTKIAGSGIYAEAVAEDDTQFLLGRVPSVGEKIAFEDGRKFVFCGITTAADVAAGQGIVDLADSTVLEDVCAVAAIGATEVVVDMTGLTVLGTAVASITANYFAECYMCVTDDTGEGYTYKIKSSSAPTAVDFEVTLTLYDPLVVALDATSDIGLVSQRYANCTLSGADGRLPVGIACVAAAANADSEKKYIWAQYSGICTVKGNLTVGDAVVCAASGAFADISTVSVTDAAGTGTEDVLDGLVQSIGTTIISDAGHSVVDLFIPGR